MAKFKIAKYTGKTNGITVNGSSYICFPYFLDGSKSTIYAEYNPKKNIKLPEYGLCNEYNTDLVFTDSIDLPQYSVHKNRVL